MAGIHRLRRSPLNLRIRGFAAVVGVVALVTAVSMVVPQVDPSSAQANLGSPSGPPVLSASNIPPSKAGARPLEPPPMLNPGDVRIIEVQNKLTHPKNKEQPKPSPSASPSSVAPPSKAPSRVQSTSPPPPPANAVARSAKCPPGVKAVTAAGCNAVAAAFPEIRTIGGLGSRPNASCHPTGYALDLMVGSNALGDRVAAWARANKARLGIALILWEVPAHFDHVHLSFAPCKN